MKKLLLTLSLSLIALPLHADGPATSPGAQGSTDLPPPRVSNPKPVAAPVEAAPAAVAPQVKAVVEPSAPQATPIQAVPAELGAVPAVAPLLAETIKDGQGGFWDRFNGKLSLGAMLGPTHSRDLLSDNNDGSLSGVSTDKTGIGGKVFIGWQPWENVGFEAAYADLGKNSFRGSASGAGSSWTIAGPVGTDHEANGWELNLLTRMPVSERLTLLLKGGAYGWNSKQTYYESGGTVVTKDKSSGTDLTYGVGFEYDVGVKNRFFWRGELQHYTVDEANLDSNALWIGFMYRR